VTVHMMTRRDGQVLSTKCGVQISRTSTTDSATIWHTDVSCQRCRQAMASKETLNDPLLGSSLIRYNKDSKQAEATASQTQGEAPMARATAEAEQETEATAEDAPKAEKKTKAPLPEGYETPVTFAKRLKHPKTGEEIRPQIVYGYIKNGKDFPAQQNSDSHWMVHVERGLEWVNALRNRQTERAAKKSAEPTPAEETPAES
jgi:hypothetical protein